MNKIRAHITIAGKVQGVYYRQEMKRQANALGVTGWVQNKPNGDVEAVLEGTQQVVDNLIIWCRRGPQLADVTGVLVDWETQKDEFYGFTIRG